MKTIQRLMDLRILDFWLFHVCNLFCCVPLGPDAAEPHSEIFQLASVPRLRFETRSALRDSMHFYFKWKDVK